ncbi:hypothetical protein V6N13_075031 [Hibiscus sabdariffa]|uniref:Uncharacterized protein n=1 Tax=Hibiscus sabdariffa TaxID=183260 RepID=A0ABR2UA96_9ROSI
MKGKLPLSSPETYNNAKKAKEEVENVTISYYVLPGHLSGVEDGSNLGKKVKRKMESVEYTSLLGYMEEFNEGKIDVAELKEDDMMKALDFSQKVMKKTSSHKYWAFLNALYDYGTDKITIADLKSKITHDFEAFRDDFDCVLDFYTNLNCPSSSLDSIHNKEKKPNQVKGSYRLRPKWASPSSEIENKPKLEHEKEKESNKHGPKRPSSSSEIEISNKGKKLKREVVKMKGKLPLSSPETYNNGKKSKKEVENVTVSYYVLPGHLSGVEGK